MSTGARADVRLPHAFPFLLVDVVRAGEPGHWAITARNCTADDPLIASDGTLPPVLIAEAMAQAAGLAAAQQHAVPTPAVLIAMNRFRCRSVRAGDVLSITMRVVRTFGRSVLVRGRLKVGHRDRAAGEFILYFPPTPDA